MRPASVTSRRRASPRISAASRSPAPARLRESLCLTALLLLLAATPAIAQTGEPSSLARYRLDDSEWNGLSSLVILAESVGAELDQVGEVDLAELPVDRPLLIVAPETELGVAGLVAWVAAGGRLFVADDFGTSPPLLAEFGISRAAPPANSGLHFDGNPALPLLPPVGIHHLTEGVSQIVANHPAALAGAGLPVIAFPGGRGLLYDMSLGEGRAVFLSDPSLMINLMLPLRDNARLVRNILGYLCAGVDPCRPLLVAQGGLVGGSPGGDGLGGGAGIRSLDERLRAFDDALGEPAVVRGTSWLLLLGTLVILGAVFPLRGAGTLTVVPRAASVPPPQSEFEFSLRRYEGRHRERTMWVPAVLLRDAFEPLFYDALGTPAPPRDGTGTRARESAAADYVRLFEATRSRWSARRRAREVAHMLESLALLAPASASLSLSQAAVDWPALRRWHSLAMEILKSMRRHDEYLSRTRGPGADRS